MPIHYDGNGLDHLRPDDMIIAEREGSEDIGLVAAVEWISREQLKLRRRKYLKVVRQATDEERDTFSKRRAFEKKALSICKERARQLDLPMKISTSRMDAKENKVIFQFTSEQRVDFRQLVRELSMILKSRIELWQIGVRDEAKSIDGFGVCGLRTCCSQWMEDFNPINIRMAKTQDINLPPSKLSGLCGRLLCCLSHEVDQYKEVSKILKPKGATIEVEGEKGVIIDRNVMMQTYVVALETGGRVTVTSDEMGNVRIPEQMKKMAKLLDTDSGSNLSPDEQQEQEAKSTGEGKEEKQQDGKGRGRRRNRGGKRRKDSNKPEGGEQQNKKPKVEAKEDKPRTGRGKRRPDNRTKKGENSDGKEPQKKSPRPPKPQAAQGQGGEEEKPRGRRGRRRGGRGRGGRGGKPKADGETPKDS